MCQYKIFLSATDKEIADKSRMRVDLFGDMKIKDIEELKDFKILYVSQGHEDLVSIKGKEVQKIVSFIERGWFGEKKEKKEEQNRNWQINNSFNCIAQFSYCNY